MDSNTLSLTVMGFSTAAVTVVIILSNNSHSSWRKDPKWPLLAITCFMSRNLQVNCQPEDTRGWGQWHRNPAKFQVWVLPLATKPEMLTWRSCKKVNIGEWGFFKKVLPRGHLRRTGRWGVDLRDSSAMHPPWQSVNFTIIVVVIECQWPLPFM